MKLQHVSAAPHPSGYRIDVSWVNPDPAAWPGVRVVRRTGTHPASPDDGVVVAEGTDLPSAPVTGGARGYSIADAGLQGETVYYYALFPYADGASGYASDRENRASAMATAAYGMAERMHGLLPAVYHRYDAAAAADGPGFLRRFLELPGSQLDLLHSAARAALGFRDLDRADGRLLPLLAQWIGWDTNLRLDTGTQRNELRSAPSLYRTIGIVPTVEATVKRVLGWESRAKEFVHNVARSNVPERMNLWTMRRGADGAWTPSPGPLSVDFDHEGRPAALTGPDGRLRLFYATLRNGRWDLWHKTLSLFPLDGALEEHLERGLVTVELRVAFAAAGFELAPHAVVRTVEGGWEIETPERDAPFTVRREAGALAVSYWTPSTRLTNTPSVDKHPAAVLRGDALHVFWDSFDPATGRWRIRYRIERDGVWSPAAVFGDDATDRRAPAAVVDQTGRTWLFWMERSTGGPGWRLRYVREEADGTWNPGSAHEFPPDDGADPRAHGDLSVVLQPAEAGGGTPRIWIFWPRRARSADGQLRWHLAARAATGIDPAELTWVHSWSPETADHRTVDATESPVDLRFRTYYVDKPLEWGPIFTLPESGGAFEARNPAAFMNRDGELELFFASNRDGSWSVWRTVVEGAEPPGWTAPERLTEPPFSQAAPAPCTVGDGTLLLYRSNESVRYASSVYRATRTVDARYAGSTTVDTRNLAKLALREGFGDFQSYVYDTGEGGVRSDRDWYARDTVGIYLDATTEDQQVIVRNRNLITNILRQFLPAPVRVVFIVPVVTREEFYTYDFPDREPQRRIGEEYADHLETLSAEAYGGIADSHTDTMDGWVRAHAWSDEHPDPATVDTTAEPVDTNVRTWHIGLEAGG
jgi:phage tail-like protein